MAVVRVEPEPQIDQGRCEDWGGTTRMILGYVYADEEPHGIYYVDWCEGPHGGRSAFVTLSSGNYGDEDASGADRRVAFGIEARCDGMGLTERPLRDRPDFLGHLVPREEALRWPQLDEAWHVCDHLSDDRRFAAVTAWLCGGLDTAVGDDEAAPTLPAACA